MNEKGMNKRDNTGANGTPTILPSPEYADELFRNYTVKYFKANIDEPGDVNELQRLETLGLQGDEIVLCDRQTYSFEGNFFVVLRYYQKRI